MSSKQDSLGDRMKRYEELTNYRLLSRTPVILRIDGRAFHTFTKGFKRPFDTLLSTVMCETLKHLCENTSNCVFGYTQSDEITLILLENFEQNNLSSPWFDNRIQKLCSIVSSMTTFIFNRSFSKHLEEEYEIFNEAWNRSVQKEKLFDRYFAAAASGATFDCRAFNVPSITEAINCVIWRQQDATKNSILSVGQSEFSHKELQGKKCNEIQDMLMLQKGINWNNFPVMYKRGVSCIRKLEDVETPNGKTQRKKWVLDYNIPILTQDWDYIKNQIEGKIG